MMTRARRRRLLLLAESHEPVEPAPVYGPEEWRDWANLIPDLIDDISGRLLSHDVAEYLRFRAACKPWRDVTADPPDAGVLDRRFRPRNWALLHLNPESRPSRRLLNLATAASIGVDLPALSTHCNLGAADGLLVLADRFTKAVRLLDPLRNAIIEFPSISSIVAAAPPKKPDYISAVFRNPGGVDPLHINGAAIDDSTSPPTLVLCLRSRTRNIVFAKPGDDHWTLVGAGQASVPMHDLSGHVLFYSLLSFGGRCYVSSPEGSVYLVELGTFPPRLVEVVNQRHLLELDTFRCQRIFSLLVSGTLVAGTKTKMLMVRFWPIVEDTDGYNQKEVFMVNGFASRIEVMEVDVAGRRLLPVTSLGRHTAFVGVTHCVLLSTDTFPSIPADQICLGCDLQQTRQFSTYRITKSRRGCKRTEPPHKFERLFEDMRMSIVPSARPCNLDQYLVWYVERTHRFNGGCFSHRHH
ncbi:hypothetical protein EJB05_50667, partial [Eragrostis curvula]